MSSLGTKGKAVQILRLNDDRSFELNENELEDILTNDRVKDKPVVVVSVAGACRQGKSFLLAFLLRFLKNGGKENWLDDLSTPLNGFEWRSGSKPHTRGIMLWDEVFLVNTPKGEEVAVLLMDTQGSFDCKSTIKECTTIFALSIMTSSVHVYNILRNIQEDHLQHLQFFAEYGRLAQEDTGSKPFQRLVFLVRDWPFPYEADYGTEGGRMILQERLEVTEAQHEDLQRLRREIWSFFSPIDCFLMPRPGQKVETENSFDGCLKDIDDKFKQKVKELVPWLLAPENLVVKQINGHKVTCQEFLNYFRATAKASNMAAVERATKFYLECIDSMPRANLDGLREAHAELLGKATDLFRKTPKFGDKSISQTYLEALTKDLVAHFDRLYKDAEQILQRAQEKEEQRKKEREEERQREEERKLERKMEKEKEEQWKKDMYELKKLECENQEKIEQLEQELSETERARNTRYKLEMAKGGMAMVASVARVATDIVKLLPR